ncbi:hypothetical protein J1N35_032774 [Gossypium stocksii]|uniref:Uncharacterized protein n=1 Tax=Gossypium stocksii TaxID=47602 RepID=A0A9D3V465_9ROSI|nr:hypothetical protein J1N35_032774 [Gossypium stocksii]
MSMNGDEPPPEFHAKDGSFGCVGSSDLSASVSVPVIDLGLLPSSKDEQGKLRLLSVAEAVSSPWSCKTVFSTSAGREAEAFQSS